MISKELVAASATPIILSILARGENYGYAIIRQVREASRGEMQWTDGMLYPVLHRLENQRLVRSIWRKAETGRKRKYYRLTREGAKVLRRTHAQWETVHATLSRLSEDAPCLT